MSTHLILLANAFYAAAAALATPSVLLLLLCALYRLRQWLTPSPDALHALHNPDAILLILSGMTRVVSTFASILGFFGRFIFDSIAIVAFITLGIAIALFLTGRGLHAQSTWARVVAGLLMTGVSLSGLISLATIRRPLLGI